MTAVPLYRFPAQMDSIGPALAHVKAASAGVEPAAVLRAETAVEELLTNSVVHGGMTGVAQASVWLSVYRSGDTLRLRYEDGFAAFDPLPAIKDALQRANSPIAQRPVGGLGLLMVYRLSDEFHYVRENGRNRVDMSFVAGRAG